MKNKAAQELGRLTRGVKKTLSEPERQRRRESLALARLSRHKPKQEDTK